LKKPGRAPKNRGQTPVSMTKEKKSMRKLLWVLLAFLTLGLSGCGYK
jgi:hypothetical protein